MRCGSLAGSKHQTDQGGRQSQPPSLVHGGDQMSRYVVKRVVQMIPILFFITIAVFFMIKIAPGDPFAGMVDPKMSLAQIERRRAELGFNKPLPYQYYQWLRGVLTGDFGWSLREKRAVIEMVGERLGPTLQLGIAATVLSFSLAIPIGVVAAARQHSVLDHLITLFAFAGISTPTFFFGLLLLKHFALGGLKLFPSSGYATPGTSWTGFRLAFDVARHLALPALVLGLVSVASLMRFVRSAMLEVLRQDYVRTARAKGIRESVVIYKHALRNALIPVITLLGLELPTIVGGAIITESIFIWPGIGRLQLTALLDRDYPVLMALNLLFAVMTMLGSLLADIGYALVDPRIRYD